MLYKFEISKTVDETLGATDPEYVHRNWPRPGAIFKNCTLRTLGRCGICCLLNPVKDVALFGERISYIVGKTQWAVKNSNQLNFRKKKERFLYFRINIQMSEAGKKNLEAEKKLLQ